MAPRLNCSHANALQLFMHAVVPKGCTLSGDTHHPFVLAIATGSVVSLKSAISFAVR